ncbi:MAG: pyridoxamine 5'-phosphate oxidase family protein, partial [Candidatus Weimeria sp.]
LKKCDKVSFTVIEDLPKQNDDFALYVNSVIVFGKIQLVEDREKVLKSAMELARHIYPEQEEFYRDDLERNRDRVQILEITPEHITGKKVHER